MLGCHNALRSPFKHFQSLKKEKTSVMIHVFEMSVAVMLFAYSLYIVVKVEQTCNSDAKGSKK